MKPICDLWCSGFLTGKKMDKNLRFIGRGANNSRLYECPFCHDTVEVESGVFYGQCPACKATIIDYKPAPHQEAFHKSSAKFKLNIGGLVI